MGECWDAIVAFSIKLAHKLLVDCHTRIQTLKYHMSKSYIIEEQVTATEQVKRDTISLPLLKKTQYKTNQNKPKQNKKKTQNLKQNPKSKSKEEKNN